MSDQTKHKLRNGVLAIIGYILSPLSWWNDLFVNIPLAYLFGSIFGLMSKSLFMPMVIVGYWLTNILGLVMMHHGTMNIVHGTRQNDLSKVIKSNIVFSIVYTLIIMILIKSGWLKFPWEYFK